MKKPQAAAVVSEINVTPMVDVMLVLLIIFMVITPLLNKGVTVEMARSNNGAEMKNADKDDAIVVYVTRDNTLFLSPTNTKIELSELPPKVTDLLKDRQDKTVYIRADARSTFKYTEDVVDGLRVAGVDQLGLLTEQLQNEKPILAQPPKG